MFFFHTKLSYWQRYGGILLSVSTEECLNFVAKYNIGPLGKGLICLYAFRNLTFRATEDSLLSLRINFLWVPIQKHKTHIKREKRIILNASERICGESIVLLIVLYKEFLLETDYKGLQREKSHKKWTKENTPWMVLLIKNLKL